MTKENTIEKFWQDFCAKRKINTELLDEAFAFGAGKEMADELSSLVDHKIKTATTSIYVPDESSSQVGKYCIVLDGSSNPVCVIQNKVYEVMPFKQVSAEHAYHEGEGDRTYDYWHKAHVDFFTKECAEEGMEEFTDETLVVCEVFTKVE
ncbi:ASCH domain-containing protein [Lactobacillus sp. ESL0791]|uniref:ASCH domain-containing protein n=1 Tax=Lactobacillus sp. ESL0791 TaxID=2983234 RepID=UPI0023F702A3|nr:ASCH domain-containing protein [Lactobacillus sp. ESL0791]MDF7638721.1 ASCH domain-containing protein [Lactobacillus sp. ESL0791]